MASWAIVNSNNNPPAANNLIDQQHYWMNNQHAINHFTQPETYPEIPPASNNLMYQQPMGQPGTYPTMPPAPNNPMYHQPMSHTTHSGSYPALPPGTNNPMYQQQFCKNNPQAMSNSTKPENYQAMLSYTPHPTNPPTVVNSPSMISTHFSQPAQQVTNSSPGQTTMNYSGDNQQLSSFNDSCVSSVSHNFLLKFILQLKFLRNGQTCSLRFQAANAFHLEIDPECHLTFKQSNYWESIDLVYAYVESKDRAFNLEESPQLAFLTPFQTNSVDYEDVIIYCKIIAYPRYSTIDNYQNIGHVQLPTVLPSPGVLPINYKNEKVINFIRKGIIPKFDVDMAIEIIREVKTHKCKVLTILCMEYLMKNTARYELRKISQAARENHLLLLQEKCLIDFEKLTIEEKENKSEKTKITKKENKSEETKITKKENKSEETKITKKEKIDKNKE